MSCDDASVKRAMLLFSFDRLDTWDDGLKPMSEGEVGALFKYPGQLHSEPKGYKALLPGWL